VDGSILASAGATFGYDTVTYARNAAMPAPRWAMTVPGAPFAATAATAATSTLTLDASAVPATADSGSTATVLRYTVGYTDTAPTTTLTVSKDVGGPFANLTRAFSFTLNVTDSAGKPVTGTFGCTGQDGQPALGGQVAVTDGEGTFTLADGQSITLDGVPVDGWVRVAELPVGGYAVSFTDGDDPGTVVYEPDTTLLPMTPDRVFAFTNTREAPPATGVSTGADGTTLLFPALALGLAMTGLWTASALRRHKEGGRP